ncbi:histidine phosphatase family protein [Streptomyces sp. DSM 41524]|uniref:Histidine phosphatase family protein n=1 Tax=Streptomyces asiaticus subsp. ignotus TaxID=3098222 RepID=A0ABU7Q416_9ACTN|nr:histidine phosphatase family protein [Streptomyces sp. DSM 41524]
MPHLLIVRHGETWHNVQRVLSSQRPGPGLNATGHEQADRLAALLRDTPIEAVYSSPLRRALETARILSQGRGAPRIAAELSEVEVGDLEGQTSQGAFDAYHTTLEAWMKGLALDSPLGGSGETARQVLDRGEGFLRRMTASHHSGTILIVTHSTFMRLTLAHLVVNLESAWVSARPVPNTGTVSLTYAPDGAPICLDWCGDQPSDCGLRDAV